MILIQEQALSEIAIWGNDAGPPFSLRKKK